MKNFANEVMEIITVIQHYIYKTGNIEVIDKYYQKNGTYSGIVEYLRDIENQKENSEKK